MAEVDRFSPTGSEEPGQKEPRSSKTSLSPQKRKAEDVPCDIPSLEKKPLINLSSGRGSAKTAGISMNIGSAKAGSGSVSKPGVKPAFNMNIGGSSASKKGVAPIKMSLSTQAKDKPAVKMKAQTVASVFNQDSESDEEEMPPEAKMRMRNLGRETPTAAGPNSFGKGNLGFCDRNRMIERDLLAQMQEFGDKADKH